MRRDLINLFAFLSAFSVTEQVLIMYISAISFISTQDNPYSTRPWVIIEESAKLTLHPNVFIAKVL